MGCAPAAHARDRAAALAARIAASSLSPIESTTRRAVETDATSPNNDSLAGERHQVRHAPTTVGEHHRQIAEHTPRLMARATLPRVRKRVAQPAGQANTISDQRQPRRPAARGQTRAVRPDIYRLCTPTSHHLHGEPPERGDRRPDIQILPAQADVSDPPTPLGPGATDESRLGVRPPRARSGPRHRAQIRAARNSSRAAAGPRRE